MRFDLTTNAGRQHPVPGPERSTEAALVPRARARATVATDTRTVAGASRAVPRGGTWGDIAQRDLSCRGKWQRGNRERFDRRFRNLLHFRRHRLRRRNRGNRNLLLAFQFCRRRRLRTLVTASPAAARPGLSEPHELLRKALRKHGLVHPCRNESGNEKEQRHSRDMDDGPGQNPRAAGGLIVEETTDVGALAFGSERQAPCRLHICLDPGTALPAWGGVRLRRIDASVAPGCFGDGRSPAAAEHAMGCGDRGRVHMGANQNCARFDPQLPAIRLRAIESSLAQRPGNAAGDVTRRFPQPRGQRAIRHDRTDSRQHQGDGREQMAAQFTQARCRPGVLDLGSGRRASRVCQHPLFVVRSRDDRDTLAWNTQPAQVAGSRGGGSWIVEEGQDERMQEQTLR